MKGEIFLNGHGCKLNTLVFPHMAKLNPNEKINKFLHINLKFSAFSGVKNNRRYIFQLLQEFKVVGHYIFYLLKALKVTGHYIFKLLEVTGRYIY